MTSSSKIYNDFASNLTNINLHSLEVVGRIRETQLQVGYFFYLITLRYKGFNAVPN